MAFKENWGYALFGWHCFQSAFYILSALDCSLAIFLCVSVLGQRRPAESLACWELKLQAAVSNPTWVLVNQTPVFRRAVSTVFSPPSLTFSLSVSLSLFLLPHPCCPFKDDLPCSKMNSFTILCSVTVSPLSFK